MKKIIFLDLEMNVIDRQTRKDALISDEIIEIGAVMLNPAFEIVSEFSSFVKPDYYDISPRCTKLTGITSQDVAQADKLAKVVERFAQWSGEQQGAATVYSWSDVDLRHLKRECEVKKIKNAIISQMFGSWFDFQKEFGKLLGYGRQLSLENAIKAVDYEFEGRQHRALVDARNSAHLFQLTKNEKEFKRRTDSIRSLFDENQHMPTLGEMFASQFALLRS